MSSSVPATLPPRDTDPWAAVGLDPVGRGLAEMVPVPVAALDGEGRVLAANRAFCALVAVPHAAELTGQSVLALRGGTWDVRALRALLADLRPGARPPDGAPAPDAAPAAADRDAPRHVLLRTPLGTYAANARAWDGAAPGEVVIVLTLDDVGGREGVDAAVGGAPRGDALRDSGADASGAPVARDAPVGGTERVLFDRLPIPTYVFRADGGEFTLVDYNEAASRVTRGLIRAVLGQAVTAIWPGHPEIVDDLARALAGEEVVRREFALTMRSTGVPRSFALTFGALPPSHVLVHAEDTTERRAADASLRESERRLRLALEAARMEVWEHELAADDGDAAVARTVEALAAGVHPDDRVRAIAAARRTLAGQAPSYDVVVRHAPAGAPDASVRWLSSTGRVIRDDAGRPARLIGVSRDVTTAQRDAEAARALAARLALTIEQLPAILWTIDTEGRFTSWAGAGLAALGLRPSDGPGQTIREFLGSGPSGDVLVGALARALAGESASFEQPVGERVFQVSTRPLRDGAQVVVGMLGFSFDITERKALEAQLVHQAFHDPLTGLANRALFRDRVDHALERTRRAEGTAARTAVLLLDLDHFKTVNDSLGHAAGDALLVGVAARLRAITRAGDTVARLGGDEFALLLEDLHHAADAHATATRVLAALAAPFALEGKAVAVAVSIGIVSAADADDADGLVRNADLALYAAKARGRGCAVAYEPAMHDAALARLELEAALRAAVDAVVRAPGEAAAASGFSLRYQPVVDVATGRAVGVEALARWSHPILGTVPPGEFVGVAEETGLIVPLGRWILREACREAAGWARSGIPAAAALTLSVNVSGRQLQDPAFVDDVRGALHASGLPPDRLVLEITESVMMADAEATLARMRTLRALGIRLAIDDFGTGYSSLAYLREYPVDVLKIDRRFVERLGADGDETAIARAIVTLASALSLVTVAEGVEGVEQLARLRALGCERAQGYLFARPLTATDLMRHLAAAPPPLDPIP